MNIKLTQQILFLEKFEEKYPNSEVMKLTPTRITIKLENGALVVVKFK